MYVWNFGPGPTKIELLKVVAFDLRRPARHVAEVIARAGYVDDARHETRLAVVDALDLGELGGIGIDQIGEFPQQRFTLRRQHVGPWALLERSARRSNRAIDIGLAGISDR